MRKILFLVFIVDFQTHIAFAEGKLSTNNYHVATLGNMKIDYLWAKDAVNTEELIENPISAPDNLVVPNSNPVHVMPIVNTTPIFWGSTWYNRRYSSDKIYGLTHWYQSFQYSTYADTLPEYLNSPLKHWVVNEIIDITPASGDPDSVLAEICNVANYIDNSKTNYYPVYTDIKRGDANYCSYHSAGMCYGHPGQFCVFFNIDDDPGCDPQSPYAPPAGRYNSQQPGTIFGINTAYQQSQGLAALANVTAHELAEVITDPATISPDGNYTYWGGWYDANGAEIADKCAWTFGPSLINSAPNGTVSVGGYYWKIQGEWSNNAQNAGTAGAGYPTQNNQLYGCISGS